MGDFQSAMKGFSFTPRTVYLITFAVWLLACLTFNGWKINAYINDPNDLDRYAHNWKFGIFVFAIFYFPIWLIGLLAALGIEVAFFARQRRAAAASKHWQP